MSAPVRRFLDESLSEAQRTTLERYGRQAVEIGRAFRQQPTSLVSIGILVSFFLIAVFAPEIAPYEPSQATIDSLKPPSATHPFGTTYLGRDVFSQWVYGARVSLLVAFVSGATVAVIGTSVGLVSGYFKGTTDLILMRIVDILYGIPATPLILVVAMFLGGSVWNVIIAMVAVLWRTMARLVRSQTLSLSERSFVKNARSKGAGDARIMFVHILPNLMPLIFIELTLVMGSAIVLEAGISFLGFGASEMTSWGTMLQLTFTSGAIRSAWWWMIPPGLGITLLVMSFFYLSRALEEITNPEIKRHG